MESFLFSFLSLKIVCNIYGPLFILFVFEIVIVSILPSINFSIMVSFISVPILKTSSPTFISLCKIFSF